MFSILGLITYFDDNKVIKGDHQKLKIQYQVDRLLINFLKNQEKVGRVSTTKLIIGCFLNNWPTLCNHLNAISNHLKVHLNILCVVYKVLYCCPWRWVCKISKAFFTIGSENMPEKECELLEAFGMWNWNHRIFSYCACLARLWLWSISTHLQEMPLNINL